MKRYQLWIGLMALSLLVGACGDQDTTLTFDNKTECGTATIKITNNDAGSVEEHTVDEGKTLVVDVKPAVSYHYEVTYAGRPGSVLKCESKSGTVMVPNAGQDANFTLVGVTPTPSATEETG